MAPAFRDWRDLSAALLEQICQLPEGMRQLVDVAPPTAADLMSWTLSVPPMSGAEYVSEEVLQRLWSELLDWVDSSNPSSVDASF